LGPPQQQSGAPDRAVPSGRPTFAVVGPQGRGVDVMEVPQTAGPEFVTETDGEDRAESDLGMTLLRSLGERLTLVLAELDVRAPRRP
jgi:hypothetical protein